MDDDLKFAVLMLLIPFLVIALVLFIILNPVSPAVFFYIMGGLLALLGVAVSMGKGMWLVAGYNTMSPIEKKDFEDTYDQKKVQRALGVLFVLLGLSMLLFTVSAPLVGILIGIVAMISVIVGFAIFTHIFEDHLLKKN